MTKIHSVIGYFIKIKHELKANNSPEDFVNVWPLEQQNNTDPICDLNFLWILTMIGFSDSTALYQLNITSKNNSEHYQHNIYIK